MVIVDTCIIIDHLRLLKVSGESILTKFIKKFPKEELVISIISVQELYEGKSSKDPSKEKELIKSISALRQLSYTFEIAKLAGCFSRDSNYSLEFTDAAIAATAVYHRADLLTLNEKDFAQIPELSLRSLS